MEPADMTATTMNLGVDTPKAAVIAIDCHRGHLDPEVATMPVSADVAETVIVANKALMDRCRAAGIPVIHLVTRYRDAQEIRANAFWRTRAEDPGNTRKNVLRHNLDGMPGCTIMPQLHMPEDRVVDTKKRYDCFLGTDLDFYLRTHGINTLIITGVNTNSCVLATVTAANVRDYAVIVATECVQTMDAPELHDAGLLCIRTAFGWTMTNEEICALQDLGFGQED
jgi:nicotinamidase-related amidase